MYMHRENSRQSVHNLLREKVLYNNGTLTVEFWNELSSLQTISKHYGFYK